MQHLLDPYPVVIDLPVAWGEMDAMGHVNNIIYFRYFESVRIAYFLKLGFLASGESAPVGPILGAIQCKFKMPLTYPDTVSVGTRITHIEADRFVMAYVVVSHKAQRIAAEGEGVVVAYNYAEGKKALLPEELKQRIQALEATAAPRA